jgi:hypothetical protein
MYRLIIGAFALLSLIGIAVAQNAGPFNAVSIGASGSNQKVGVAPQSAAGATALQLTTVPGNVYSISAFNRTATAGVLILYNGSSTPGTGALTAANVLGCVAIAASSSAGINYAPGPPAFMSTGAVVLVSSGANCFTYTTGVITADIFGSAL